MKTLLLAITLVTLGSVQPQMRHQGHNRTDSANVLDEIKKIEHDLDALKNLPDLVLEDETEDVETQELKFRWEDFKASLERWIAHLFCCSSKRDKK